MWVNCGIDINWAFPSGDFWNDKRMWNKSSLWERQVLQRKHAIYILTREVYFYFSTLLFFWFFKFSLTWTPWHRTLCALCAACETGSRCRPLLLWRPRGAQHNTGAPGFDGSSLFGGFLVTHCCLAQLRNRSEAAADATERLVTYCKSELQRFLRHFEINVFDLITLYWVPQCAGRLNGIRDY